MKTEDELLLLFMYLEGFTEEDMYDVNTIESARVSFRFSLFKFGRRISHAIVIFSGSLKGFANKLSGESIETYEYHVEEYPVENSLDNKSLASRNKIFAQHDKKQSIRHQVLNRKPRHLNKKIIR